MLPPGLVSVQAITKVAGKRKHGTTTKGNVYLRALLAEIVWGISHTRDNYLAAKSHRLARRIGKTKAIVAVSHTVAVNFYHMITKRMPYQGCHTESCVMAHCCKARKLGLDWG